MPLNPRDSHPSQLRILSSRGGIGGYQDRNRKEKHPLRDKIIVAVISAILGAGAVGLYFTQNDFLVTSNNSNVFTVTNSGSTETIRETVTVTNTTEINRLNQQISNLQNEVNQLNQQVSSLTPVAIFGPVNVTGWFNSASSISFSSQGITYTVTIDSGSFQIYLPRGQVYQVVVHGTGWFGVGWDQPPASSPQLDLTSYSLRSYHVSYIVHR